MKQTQERYEADDWCKWSILWLDLVECKYPYPESPHLIDPWIWQFSHMLVFGCEHA